jgi:hypothetical protein
MAVAGDAVLVRVEAVGEIGQAGIASERVGQKRDEGGLPRLGTQMGARVPQMDAEDPLVVQIGRQIGDGAVEPVDLRPVDGIEEHRAEQPVPELGAGGRGDIVGQQQGPDFPEDPLARSEETIDRHLVEVPQMRAVLPGIDDIAADEMPDIAAAPLQIEEMIALEGKGAQQDTSLSIHSPPCS